MTSITRTLSLAAVVAASLSLGACAGMSRDTRDTAIGAAVGGVAGSVVTGSPVGAIGGAVIGGVIGHEEGKK